MDNTFVCLGWIIIYIVFIIGLWMYLDNVNRPEYSKKESAAASRQRTIALVLMVGSLGAGISLWFISRTRKQTAEMPQDYSSCQNCKTWHLSRGQLKCDDIQRYEDDCASCVRDLVIGGESARAQNTYKKVADVAATKNKACTRARAAQQRLRTSQQRRAEQKLAGIMKVQKELGRPEAGAIFFPQVPT